MSTKVHESPKETCFRHHCSRSHLYNLAGAGKIIMRKNGRRTLVDIASADSYFNNLPPAKIKPPPVQPTETAPVETHRGRGRPRKHPAPVITALPTVPDMAAPPTQPVEAMPASTTGER